MSPAVRIIQPRGVLGREILNTAGEILEVEALEQEALLLRLQRHVLQLYCDVIFVAQLF